MSNHALLHVPKHLIAIATIGAAAALVGCASTPPPTSQLATAQQALNAADTAESARYAPVELRKAREKMLQAEQANVAEEYERARYLAEQAEWDARVAERKARAEKALKVVGEAERGTQELREETLRGLQ
ncbi:DUF4398 domain-containing protein [Pseudomonas sp. G11-1]|jgi:hypothetical protein|uniref:DUF4398 domain-containing protein n=1 Tax=Halopseudomonas bauzanensis TaxID=653930 RepID=A0A031MG67_9GAMM|nr:DUF4398 domain-containing protein [Halopseudomonas bauzanensis]MCO5787115.1 DUF4398 domain-containing protein [Pseudomonas sp. G11-1]MCO5790341.1 DUF4398 domain-containing protein [Pseudomonas sp. G11-2]EZQ18774.1 chromosome partitioning protein ParA [Halopseudomonas bauzanensis]TKA92147.1 DUF4398 domain-containing protein [Halopseudomonas bauzanensis]SES25389.1 protein of unknown function [Halopseudomonas bauzanensis]